MLLVEPFYEALYGCLLIRSVSNVSVYCQVLYVSPATFLQHILQIIMAME